MDKENLTLLTDLYQLTMMQGYLDSGIHQKEVVFDLFYRQNPCENVFAITAGYSKPSSISRTCIFLKVIWIIFVP